MVEHIRELLSFYVKQLNEYTSKEDIDVDAIEVIEHQINWCVEELTGRKVVA